MRQTSDIICAQISVKQKIAIIGLTEHEWPSSDIFNGLQTLNTCVVTQNALYSPDRPVESQLGPWGYKQHGPLCRSSSTGARGATTKANHFKTLIKHWYSIMQPSSRTNLTSKEVLRELTNERPTNGFLNIILQ